MVGPRSSARRHAGFSLIEMLFVLAIIGTVSTIAIIVMPFARATAAADSSVAALSSVLRTAREQAISQRRNIRVTFTDPNQVVIERVEVPGPGTTVLNTITLDNLSAYRQFDGVPDTPDAFGNTTSAWFGGATTIAFTSEGEFVDENGDPINGSVFIGREDEPLSARAVTVFGPTALVREWRWNGVIWTN